MITFKIEHFESEEQATKLFGELVPLYDAHAAEIGMPSTGADAVMAVGPAWQAGAIKLITATSEDKYVGYSIWNYGTSWMSKKNFATLSGMYLNKEHRGTNGRAFLAYCKQAFLIIGAPHIFAIGDEGTGFDKWLRRQSKGIAQTIYKL